MTGFSQEVKDQIINSTDIVELISEYVQLEKKGKNYFGLCPFHNDSSPSMSVSPDKQIYKCFSCGASGNAITFHMDFNGNSFSESLSELAQRANISVPEIASFKKRETFVNPLVKSSHEINDVTSKLFNHFINSTEEGKNALEYLNKRGFTADSIKKYKIGYIGKTQIDVFNFLKMKNYTEEQIIASGIALINDRGYLDRFRNRIMFPLLDEHNNVVGFSGRVIGQGEPKYLNSPETEVFKKSQLLFNFNNAKKEIRKLNYAILMEGFMDVIKADIFEIPNAIATMGTAFTDAQARMLRRVTDTIYLCFDGDNAGQNAALASIKVLKNYSFNIKVVKLTNGLDPDDFLTKYGRDAFIANLEKSISVIDFQINKLYKEADLTSEESKAMFVRKSFAVIETLQDKMAESLYLDKLAKVLSISPSIINNSYFGNKRIDKEEVKPQQQIPQKKQVFNAYQRAEHIILAAMIENKSNCKKFEEELGGLPTEEYNILANYVVSYYKKYDKIKDASFINYLEEKTDIINTFVWIIDNVEKAFLNIASVSGCFDKIKQYSTNVRIKDLQDKISHTLDETEKLNYANELFELQRKLKKY